MSNLVLHENWEEGTQIIATTPMDNEILRSYLEETFHTKIPITREMQIRVTEYDGKSLVLKAALAPNVNDKGTAFGGSLFPLLVLAGWGLLHLKLKEEGIPSDIMIHNSSVTYFLPVTEALEAGCELLDSSEYTRFIEDLVTRGRGRIPLVARAISCNRTAVEFRGNYAAIATRV